ncbi:hypothetical protein ACWGN5_40155 [Streptomyces sp. NPDC055815]
MTSRRDRPIPPGTSPLGQAATLRVNVAPLKVGDHAAEEKQQDDTLFEEPPRSTPKTKPGRSRGGRSAPPAAADAIPTTIRFDPEEAAEIDLWILTLREEAGRRQLDKAEVFRELTRLAREHDPTHKALLRRIR